MEQISRISKEEWTLGLIEDFYSFFSQNFGNCFQVAINMVHIWSIYYIHIWFGILPAGLIELDDGNIETGKPVIFI